MDYKNIYYKIIENAKQEIKEDRRNIGYFEKHHILPKSLGGSNDENNLVKLTAREHFICHWLLVKMYDKGTIERNKMLCALWRMNNNGSKSHKEHYINSRAYEKLRIEFAKTVSEITSISQSGKNNSQYGCKWYTNRNTGESKKFKEKPDNIWLEGRNIFNKHELWSIKTKKPLLWKNGKFCNTKLEFDKNRNDKIIKETKILWEKYCSYEYSLISFAADNNLSYTTLRKHFNKYIPEYHGENNNRHYNRNYNRNYNRKYNKNKIKEKTKLRAQQWWNMLHSGTFNNLNEFAENINKSKMTIYNTFAKYIPIMKKIKNTKNKFKSNRNLINVFE